MNVLIDPRSYKRSFSTKVKKKFEHVKKNFEQADGIVNTIQERVSMVLGSHSVFFPKLQFLNDKLLLQWNLDLRKPDLRKDLDLRKIVAKNDFLIHKLFELRTIF